MFRQRFAKVPWLLTVACLLLVTTIFHSAAGISSPKKNTVVSSLKNKRLPMKDTGVLDRVLNERGGGAVGGYAVKAFDELVPFGWGDHTIVTPANRWTLLAGYWVVCGVVAHLMGVLDYAFQQEWLAPNVWYFVHLIIHLPLHLAVWDWAAFSFDRPFRYFATVVYPLMHNFDSLMWFSVFDIGKLILRKVYTGETSKLVQFLAGWAVYALYLMWHRATLELRYLPEHHPEPPSDTFPEGRGRKALYVLAGIITSIPMLAVYHVFDDMLWGLMIQYAYNLFIAIRIRMPDPWDKYDNSDRDNNKEKWLPFMNRKSY